MSAGKNPERRQEKVSLKKSYSLGSNKHEINSCYLSNHLIDIFTFSFNPLKASVALIKNPVISTANQLTGFYMWATLALNGLTSRHSTAQS